MGNKYVKASPSHQSLNSPSSSTYELKPSQTTINKIIFFYKIYKSKRKNENDEKRWFCKSYLSESNELRLKEGRKRKRWTDKDM